MYSLSLVGCAKFLLHIEDGIGVPPSTRKTGVLRHQFSLYDTILLLIDIIVKYFYLHNILLNNIFILYFTL